MSFFDADDIPDSALLEKTVRKLEETGADVLGYKYIREYDEGIESMPMGVREEALPDGKNVFNYHSGGRSPERSI